jgi:hypothetical protein
MNDDSRQSSFPFRLTKRTPRRVWPKRDKDTVPAPPRVDVFDLVPPTDDVAHLEKCLELTDKSTPLHRAVLWKPEDEGDKAIRELLVWFGRQVALPRPPRYVCCGTIHAPSETYEERQAKNNAR